MNKMSYKKSLPPIFFLKFAFNVFNISRKFHWEKNPVTVSFLDFQWDPSHLLNAHGISQGAELHQLYTFCYRNDIDFAKIKKWFGFRLYILWHSMQGVVPNHVFSKTIGLKYSISFDKISTPYGNILTTA